MESLYVCGFTLAIYECSEELFLVLGREAIFISNRRLFLGTGTFGIVTLCRFPDLLSFAAVVWWLY